MGLSISVFKLIKNSVVTNAIFENFKLNFECNKIFLMFKIHKLTDGLQLSNKQRDILKSKQKFRCLP